VASQKKISPKLKLNLDETHWPGKNKMPDDLSEPILSDNAREILIKRYLIKDDDGNPLESPKELFWRVAYYIAAADLKYNKKTDHLKLAREYYQLISTTDFLPNSPTLRGAGREIHQLSACFVLPIEDTMDGIFTTLHDMALIHKGGGGTGFSFGKLRPEGDIVGVTGGIAGGPISFMRIFDSVAQEVMQGGVRVGANMGILPITHPDIQKFINCKKDGASFRNFNLSVAVTDDFMERVEKGENYDLINPRTNEKMDRLNAKEIFNEIIENAWTNGDPGIIFIDSMNRDNPTPALGKIESTNPCGEQPLLPYESCNLGSINLSRLVTLDKINWDKLKNIVHLAVRFLDNVIDVNKYAVREVEKITKANRKIGLGVMGFADMLAQLEIPYASEKAVVLAQKVMGFIQRESQNASHQLAKKRGPFPNFKNSIYAKKEPIRNATITTIAPTGTLSLIGGCSGGIEPFFALAYKKKSLFNKDGSASLEQIYVNQTFENIAKKIGFYSRDLLEKVIDTGSVADLKEVSKKYKDIFATAGEIDPEWHIKMQAAFQTHVDNAVSKTINFANKATIEDVKNVYLTAYKTKCKGITIYRDGSRDVQVLTKGKHDNQIIKTTPDNDLILDTSITHQKLAPRERPDKIAGMTYKVITGYGNMYVTINEDEFGDPFEIFTHIGKSGGFFAAKAEAISRLISLALRSGIDAHEIVDQLKGIRGPNPAWGEKGMVLSMPDAIGQILDLHIKKNQEQLSLDNYQKQINPENLENPNQENLISAGSNNDAPDNHQSAEKLKTLADLGDAPACPECHEVLELGEGCLKCHFCGYSKCA